MKNIGKGIYGQIGKQTLFISSGRCRVFRDGRSFNGIGADGLFITASKSEQRGSSKNYSLMNRQAPKWFLPV